MTTTVDIPESLLELAMKRAKTDHPDQAVMAALENYTRPRSQKDLIALMGTSDGFYTSEELDRLREIDS